MAKYTKERQEDKYLIKPKALSPSDWFVSLQKKKVGKEIKLICYCTAENNTDFFFKSIK